MKTIFFKNAQLKEEATQDGDPIAGTYCPDPLKDDPLAGIGFEVYFRGDRAKFYKDAAMTQEAKEGDEVVATDTDGHIVHWNKPLRITKGGVSGLQAKEDGRVFPQLA